MATTHAHACNSLTYVLKPINILLKIDVQKMQSPVLELSNSGNYTPWPTIIDCHTVSSSIPYIILNNEPLVVLMLIIK